jgi:hypothetical protein
VFTSGTASDLSQGQFNEMIVQDVVERTDRWKKHRTYRKRLERVEPDTHGNEHFYVRWKQVARDNRWFKYGRDVEKTIDALVRSGALAYLMVPSLKEGRDDKVVYEANKAWVTSL